MNAKLLLGTVASAIFLAATPALADDAPKFGRAGDIALSWNHGMAFNEVDLYGGAGDFQATYFVVPNLSLGLGVGVQWFNGSLAGNDGGSNATLLHLGPRVGYNIALGEHVSWWPQVGVDFRMLSQSNTSAGTTSSSDSKAFGLTVLAPILIHPVRGFFVGAGPAFYTEFMNKTTSSSSLTTGSSDHDNAKLTTLGLIATIGGSF
jgi:hypothetical protein